MEFHITSPYGKSSPTTTTTASTETSCTTSLTQVVSSFDLVEVRKTTALICPFDLTGIFHGRQYDFGSNNDRNYEQTLVAAHRQVRRAFRPFSISEAEARNYDITQDTMVTLRWSYDSTLSMTRKPMPSTIQHKIYS